MIVIDNQSTTASQNDARQFKFCQNYGAKIDINAVICPYCGVALPAFTPASSTPAATTTDGKEGSYWWSVLGFFVPVAGLVLYIVWRTSEPKSANAAGLGALIHVVLWTAILAFFVTLAIMTA